MKRLLIAGITLAVLASSSAAFASHRSFTLDYNGQQFQGRGSVLRLRQAFRQQYPRRNLSNFEVTSVELIGKTRIGRGGAEAIFGRNYTGRQNVPGNPRDFNTNARFSYYNVEFFNPGRDDRPLQLQLYGNHRVSQVILNVRRIGGGGGGGPARNYIDLGTVKAPKFITVENRF